MWLGDDPDLALVHADMGAWLDARPECKCPALCVCDDTDRPSVYHPA